MKKKEKEELEKEKKILDDCLDKFPILDPKAERYKKYLFVPIAFYILYLIITFIIIVNNGTMVKECTVDTPICFLDSASIYFEPLLAIIIFALAILLLLNIAGLFYEPLIYFALFPECIMTLFIAFINFKMLLIFIIIIIPKFLFLYYDKRDEDLLIEKI